MNKPRVSIIVAIDEKRGIGKNNELLFKISEDLKRFRQLTNGHPVIMGWNTFESIGRELPGRLNIRLTRDSSKKIEPNSGFNKSVIYHDLQSALKRATKDELDQHTEAAEIFIIGGGQIFEIALEENLVDRIYLTEVKGNYNADTFFPDYEGFGFKPTEPRQQKKSDGYEYSFITLEKK
jgi:dihydrofolate reductase